MKMKVTIDNQTYDVEIEDLQARPVIAIVDGERFEVWPESEQSAEAHIQAPAAPAASASTSMPQTLPAPSTGGAKAVNSPLPGVIVAVLVKPGDTISHGQELCTLEAMKMKNAIKSNREGMIESIEISVGDQVAHGQVLMTFTD
jgi:glutaconyl-CoA/methylmalonyl-CoA decarboxylase subunit gamma